MTFIQRMFAEEQKAEEQKQETKEAEVKEEPKKEEPRYTDADLDRIISEKFSRWQKKQEEAVNEAKKLAEMNAQQKAEYERDQLQKELDSLRAEKTRAEMTKTARQMLKEEAVNIDDALVDMLVSDTAEATSANVKSFAAAYKTAVQDGIKEALKGGTPKTGSAPKITKEEILKIQNTAERQRMIQENLELFR